MHPIVPIIAGLIAYFLLSKEDEPKGGDADGKNGDHRSAGDPGGKSNRDGTDGDRKGRVSVTPLWSKTLEEKLAQQKQEITDAFQNQFDSFRRSFGDHRPGEPDPAKGDGKTQGITGDPDPADDKDKGGKPKKGE